MEGLLWVIVIGYILIRLVGMNALNRRVDNLAAEVNQLNRKIHGIAEAPQEADAWPEPAENSTADPLAQPLKMAAEPLPYTVTPKPKPAPDIKTLLDFEKLFGGKIFIWVGGVALALAGLFLVQYSIAQGWLEPPVRVALGAIFGVGLIAIAIRFKPDYPLIREVLTGAGVLALYASLFAGSSLYHFWPPAVALLLMSLVTVAAIGLAVLIGRRIAYLGLIGGYVTPLIVGATEPNTLGLFGYLLLLGVGLGEIGLRRGWPPLAVWGACGGAFWLIFHVITLFSADDTLILAGFLLVSTFWQVAIVSRLRPIPSNTKYRYTNIIFIISLLALVLLCVRAQYDLPVILAAFLMLAGLVLFQRLRNMGRMSLTITSLGAILIFLFWPSEMSAQAYMFFGLGLLLLYSLASWSALPAWYWAFASSIIGVLGFLVAYGKWSNMDVEILANFQLAPIYGPVIWTGAALAMAAYFTGMATMTTRRYSGHWWQAEEAISSYVAAAATFIALALAIRLTGETLVLGWSAEIAALLLLSARFTLPALRACAVTLSVMLMAYLLGNILVGGEFSNKDLGAIALRYGLPTLLFTIAALRLPVKRPYWHGEFYELSAPLMGLLWFYMSARAIVALALPHDPADAAWSNGFLISAALAVSYLCIRLGITAERRMLRRVGKGIGYVTLIGLMLSYALFANPLWSHIAIGTPPVINALFFIFGLPALLVTLLARPLAADENKQGRFYFYAYGLLLLFFFTIGTVRQFFHGTYIMGSGMEAFELYIHSVAIIAAAFLLLLAGILRDSKTLRIGSLIYMSLGTLKAFLWDMGDLEGLWKVVAFIGLGASLVAIGYIYQRFGLLIGNSKKP